MNKTILLVTLALFTIAPLLSQNSCSKYYPMKDGSSLEYTTYNKKGKADGITKYTITGVNTAENETSSKFHINFSNPKGKKEFEMEYNITCTGSGIKIDYMSLMPSQMTAQYEALDAELNFSGTDIELPNNLSVGQALDNANVSMNMTMGGIDMMISVEIVDRKVEARESITTSAGTFDCYQIAETIKTNTMGVSIEMTSKTWLSEGVGVVKSETFRKNGKPEGSSILTRFN